MNRNILLCGVGGQGTVLASKLIASAAMKKGLMVMSAETIGMAQKGGSVSSHIRLGEEVYAPLLGKDSADLLLAFEPAEAVRLLPCLREDGVAVVNTTPVVPVTAALRGGSYDAGEMLAYLRREVPNLIAVDGARACADLGSPRVTNLVLLGAALRSGVLGLTEEELTEALRERVKPQYIDLNLRALHYYENREEAL